jgi:hypothetical protein
VLQYYMKSKVEAGLPKYYQCLTISSCSWVIQQTKNVDSQPENNRKILCKILMTLSIQTQAISRTLLDSLAGLQHTHISRTLILPVH